MTKRTETEKLSGKVPGVDTVTFGGKAFAIHEPGMEAYAPILDAVLVLEEAEKDSPTEREQVKLVIDCAMQMLQHWDGNIGEHREWILENGTATDLLAFFAKAAHVVTVPLTNLPGLFGVTAPAANRTQRRTAKKKKSGR